MAVRKVWLRPLAEKSNPWTQGSVRTASKWPQDSQGPIFRPTRLFSTYFGQDLIFLARLENQVWAKTWTGTRDQACKFRNFLLGPIPELFWTLCLPKDREMREIMSGPLRQECLVWVLGHIFPHMSWSCVKKIESSICSYLNLKVSFKLSCGACVPLFYMILFLILQMRGK